MQQLVFLGNFNDNSIKKESPNKRNKLNMTFMHNMIYFLNWPSVVLRCGGMSQTESLPINDFVCIVFSCEVFQQRQVLYSWIICFSIFFLNQIYWGILLCKKCYWLSISALTCEELGRCYSVLTTMKSWA